MRIRKAKKEDLKDMLKIVELNSPNYPKDIVKKELNEMFSKSFLKPIYLVMEIEKEIIGFGGFIQSWEDNKIINLFWINTHPNYKGKKVATKLINRLIREIKKIRDPKSKMITLSTNIPEFYKKFGFNIMGPKYDKDYVLMERKLK